MKKLCALILAMLLVFSMSACGCQNSKDMDNNMTQSPTSTTERTEPSTADTMPSIVDPTILDPTFETNIPDGTVNENSTTDTDGTNP